MIKNKSEEMKPFRIGSPFQAHQNITKLWSFAIERFLYSYPLTHLLSGRNFLVRR